MKEKLLEHFTIRWSEKLKICARKNHTIIYDVKKSEFNNFCNIDIIEL